MVASVRLVETMSLNKGVGVLYIMLGSMLVENCIPYFKVSLGMLVMMSVSMYGIFGVPDAFFTWMLNTLTMFVQGGEWEIFSLGVDSSVETNDSGVLDLADATYQDEMRYALGTLFFYLFIIVTNIILVNLLIAQMSDTYAKIQENSDTEWKYKRAEIVKDLYHSSLAPPPFNLVNITGAWLRNALCGAKKVKGEKGDAEWTSHKSLIRWGRPVKLSRRSAGTQASSTRRKTVNVKIA